MILGNMAYVKKISAFEFIFDCIKKEYELVGAVFPFKDMAEFSSWSHQEENLSWYDQHRLTKDQHIELKRFFIEHYYDHKPKSTSRKYIEEKVFPWFCLAYEFPVIE